MCANNYFNIKRSEKNYCKNQTVHFLTHSVYHNCRKMFTSAFNRWRRLQLTAAKCHNVIHIQLLQAYSLSILLNWNYCNIIHLESAPRWATFDAGVLWQILGMVSDKFKRVASCHRAIVTHVSDQHNLVFPHCDTTHAWHPVPTSRTSPVFHLNLQHLRQNEV